MLTNFLVYHLASGQAFFSGAAAILLACGLPIRGKNYWAQRSRNLLLAVGVILVTVSATPLPMAAYAFLAAVTLTWLCCEGVPRISLPWRRVARAVTVSIWTAAVLCEVPYHFMPMLPRIEHPQLGVIGDSVTAGVGEKGERTWPVLLAEHNRILVHDHAAVGATVTSASRQAAALTNAETLVLLEIGGNDLLGTTTPREFERGLNALLDTICLPSRTVVMFELPLPPFYNAFGMAQRRSARTHHVALIPKRILLGVLRTDASTLDSIHLSTAGHERMAAVVWSVVRTAFQ